MKISDNLKTLVATIGIIVILSTTWFLGTGCACPFAPPGATLDEKISTLLIWFVDAYGERLKEEDPLPRKTPLPVKHENIKYEERSPAQGGSMTGKRGC